MPPRSSLPRATSPRRRSTRASNPPPLPTPASTKAGTSVSSTSSTPAKPSEERGIGLATPTSLTDADDDEPTGVANGLKKRKAAESPMTNADVEDKPLSKRQVLESVTIPIRRPNGKSKLSTEKTTSADNLTLESRASRSSRLVPEEDTKPTIDVDDTLDTPTSDASAKRPTRASKVGQPFNIGSYSSVKKQPLSSLQLGKEDLDDDELALTDSTPADSPMPRRAGKTAVRGRRSIQVQETESEAVTDQEDSEASAPVRGRGGRSIAAGKKKGKAPVKGKGKAAAFSDDEEASEASESDDDFAMDSEDEARQVKKAMRASKVAAQSSASSSRATSVSRGKGKGKVASHQKLGGKSPRASLARVAAAKAAEKRMRMVDDDDGADSSGLSDDESEFEGSDDGTPATGGGDDEEMSSDLSDADSDDEDPNTSEEEALAKFKSKSKAKGYRLDGGDGDSMPSDFGNDPAHSLAEMRARRRAAAQKAKKNNTPIKKEEEKLKKELGRKLTQGEKNLIRLRMHHKELQDCWGDLATKIEPVKPVPMEAHPSLKLTLLPFQKESLYWMKKQEKGPWAGGMLADEMGMGKTIQTIALLLSEPRRKPSLVVAPVVALMQWKHEIETHAEGFSVCLWHGSSRVKSAELKKFDVVLVSYGTLEASFRRQQRGFKRGNVFIKETSPMHEFEWYRVVLDEAHNIKERSTNAAKAAFALKAKYRWCLSGTPLQNRVGELYSLVRFLGADPFSYYFCKKCDCKSLHWQFSDRRHCDQCKHKPMDHVSLWNSEILTPIARYGIEEGGPGQTAFKKLKILLDRMMLRRTKLERADDLGLPPRTIVVRRDFFSPQEKELYMSLFTNAKRQFNTYLDSGTVLNNYSNIFSLITRMRQMACHPDLVLRSKTSTLAQTVSEGTVCRLCNDTAEDAIISACKHVFDRECIRQYLEVQELRGHRPECPVCHIEISIDLEQEAIEVDEEKGKKARQGILSRLNLDNWRSSSKLEALVEELEKLRRQDCTIKSLVFSQFVSFLDLIAFRLQRAGFNICRLEGGMTPQQRDATIQHFMKNTHVTVFLISLKAGGVALNLTEASMVFMMDSWWNPSVEYQAMDRIHRLGQKRPVKVIKLVVEDSIEDQIVQLQHKKLAMTEAALSRDPDAALGKLTVEDLGFLFKL